MEKRNNVVTFAGGAVTLLGDEIKVGQKAPDFTVVKNDLSEIKLSDLAGKKVIISAVPSIDTGICELQTIRFNKEASQLDDTVILTVSCDLPFAQGRFCAAKNIDKAIVASDYKTHDFGKKYGFLVEELALLARGIVVVDKDGVVKHVEYVKEITTHPDYDAALAVVKNL